MPVVGIAVSVHHINLLSILLRCNGFIKIQKAVVDQMGSRPPNSEHDLFLVQVFFGKKLWSFFLVQSLSWSSLTVLHNPLFVAHHNLIKKCSLLLHRLREDNTSTIFFFFFLVSTWGIPLIKLFPFPICFKYRMTVEWSMLSSWATFYVGVRGSASMMALNLLLSTSDGWPLCFSSSRLSSPLRDSLNHNCTVHSLALSGSNALLMLWVVSAAFMTHFQLK